jgi:hypothetical protein
VSVCDVNVDAAPFGDVVVAGDLGALVPGQGPSQRWRDALKGPAERVVGSVRCFVGDSSEPEMPAGPIKERDQRRPVVGANDQISFEVADLDTVVGDSGAGADWVERPQRM